MSDNSVIHLNGSAHLDPIWLWRWQEGCAEVLQTFRAALDRLNEYDDFVFTCSSAAYYQWVEEIDPELFEKVKEKVKEGRWVPVNGWYVQPDCNIPSGESFARQALYSQLYYYEKFGKICRTGYNVDSFGHNAMLPQLLRLGGMTSYVMMRPDKKENPDAPQYAFIWESLDGSKVITYRIPTGYAQTGKRELDIAFDAMEEGIKETGHSMMLFYGVGNHGGGPTKWDIDYLKANNGREGLHPLRFSSPDRYFAALSLEMPDLPVWKDELQHHASGCYSATSLVKQLNRQAENLLGASEMFTTVASKAYGMKNATESFKEAWKEVCFNQFHDVLCGCSIMEAYEDAKLSFGHAMNIASKKYNEATLRIASQIDTWIDGVSDPVESYTRHRSADKNFPRPVVVFNPLSFDINVPVRAYCSSLSVQDSDGNDVIFQNVRSSRSNDTHKDTVFMAYVPALGYATYWLKWCPEDEEAELAVSDIKTDADTLTLENKYIKVRFSKETGFITSLTDKATGFDYASDTKPVAVPTVMDDSTTDTWAHNIFTFHNIKGIMKLEDIRLVENGPARAVIRTKHSFGKSYLSQDFVLGSEQKVLRVKCRALWQEQFTMLKMSFPVEGQELINTYEIPAGYIKRPCNGEEEPAARWGAISFTADNKRLGLAVLNDSKYSYDCPDSDLRITLLRNVIFADHYSSRPYADFNFTDEGLQRFEYGIYPHSGETEKTAVTNEAALFNMRPVNIPESYHKGAMPQKKSFITVSCDNIIMTAMKYTEDNSGDVIIRLYETRGEDTQANIICDTLNAAFRVDFGHNETKTFRITPDGRASEVNFLEGINIKA